MVTIRPATAADVDRMAEIVNHVPGDEPVALVGDVELARQYGIGLFKLDPQPNEIRKTMVAAEDDTIVGVFQYQYGEVGRPHSRLAVLLMLVRLLGPIRFLRRLPAIRSRGNVDIDVPAGSFQIANLHVAAGYQDRGIGGQLLAWGETRARELGAARIAIITTTKYPSIPWYERAGFRITRTSTDPTYERFTGIEGRVLLVKDLTS